MIDDMHKRATATEKKRTCCPSTLSLYTTASSLEKKRGETTITFSSSSNEEQEEKEQEQEQENVRRENTIINQR